MLETTKTELLIVSSAERERVGDRVDVLDKVKALQLLPDGMHLTIDLVARYYDVHQDAIEACIRNNHDELTANGFVTLAGERLSAFKAECGYQSRAPRLSLFNRRAVLRVGFLLRDSSVARAVRDAVQDAYEAQTFRVPQSFAEALELAAHQARELETIVPKAEAFDQLMSAEGDYPMAVAAQILGLGQNTLFARLRDEHVLIAGGKRHNTPLQQYLKHFRVVTSTYDDGEKAHVKYTTFVRPSGLDWIRKLLKLPAPTA